MEQTRTEQFKAKASEVGAKIKELVKKGNARRIIVKDESGKKIVEIPLTAGVVGIVLAPWVGAIGLVATLVGNCTIEVERDITKEA